MAAVTSRAHGSLTLQAKYECIYFETGLLQEPMRFDTLNFMYVTKTTFKTSFKWK